MANLKSAAILAALALSACSGADYSGGSDTSDSNAAAIMLMGGTAFMNGWNQGRGLSAPVTCWNYGVMTQCQ